MTGSTIVFRVDASDRMGGGHVLRCLALAEQLVQRGADIRFLYADLTPGLEQRVETVARLSRIESSDAPLGEGWDSAPMPAAAQAEDWHRSCAALAGTAPHWIVVDHYRLDRSWEREARETGARILVIDDLANRPHDCDLLLDQTAGREAADYRPLVPAHCTLLTGAHHALLRPEFARARASALARRRDASAVRTLLLSLGSTDIGGATAQVLEPLVEANIGCAIDVVIGADAPSRAVVERLAAKGAVRMHTDVRDMASLIAQADLAIGAAGVSSWERCCLGLPTVTLVLAHNQRLVARNLEALGAARVAETPLEAAQEAAALVSQPDRLASMSAAAAAITDGEGAVRLADLMIAPERAGGSADLTVREADQGDSERIWLWRNDPLMRAMAKSHDPIAWSAHAAWFARRLADAGCVLLIAELGGKAVGMVRFDREEDESHIVSINLAPASRGAGLGSRTLGLACTAFLERFPAARLEAEVREGNIASEHIFLRNGFAPADQGDRTAYRRYRRLPGTR